MDGVEQVPVELAAETDGFEEGGLDQPGAAALGDRLELQPGPPRHLHLRAKEQELGRVDLFHSPEIEGVALFEIARVAAAPPEPGAADEPVEEPAQAPRPVPEEPPALTSEGQNRPIGRLLVGGGKAAAGFADRAPDSD